MSRKISAQSVQGSIFSIESFETRTDSGNLCDASRSKNSLFIVFGSVVLGCILLYYFSYIVRRPDTFKITCKELELGDGFCHDSMNVEDCAYDKGDCCLANNKSKQFCKICICYHNLVVDEALITTISTPSTISTTALALNHEPCKSDRNKLLFISYQGFDVTYELFELTFRKKCFLKHSESKINLDTAMLTFWTDQAGGKKPQVIACGGQNELTFGQKSCLDLKTGAIKFDMQKVRRSPSYVRMNQSHILVYSGSDYYMKTVEQMEYVTYQGSSKSRPISQTFMGFQVKKYSCLLKWTANEVFIIGGMDLMSDRLSNEVSKYDFASHTIIQASQLNFARAKCACGSVDSLTFNSKKILIVIGSHAETEARVDNGPFVTVVNKFPRGYVTGLSVIEDNTRLILAGGVGSNEELDSKIYLLTCTFLPTCLFEKTNMELAKIRPYGTGILITNYTIFLHLAPNNGN